MAEQIFKVRNDGQAYEQKAIPLFEEKELQASQFQLLIDLPSLASPDPVSIAEVVVTISGPELVEEQGCGDCVEDLIDELNELTMVIENSTGLLPSVNETQDQLLQQGIMETQLSVKDYEDTLLVLAVVLGVQPPLEDVNISSSVVRFDLLLVPPIPSKLDQLKSLLDSVSRFDIDTEDLEALLDMIEPNLEILLSRYTELMTIASSRRDNSTRLIVALNEELNATLLALLEASEILETISMRNFTAEEAELREYQAITQSAFALATRLWNSAINTSNQVERINGTLGDLVSLLQEVFDVASEASRQSNEALGNVRIIDDFIQQIQDLQSDFLSLDFLLGEEITNVTQILAAALESLQMANSSLQLSSSLFLNLTSLTSLLREEVDQYADLLSPYQLPDSCNLTSACTESELYAEILHSNASEIVNSTTSVSTLNRARRFLENIIENNELFDFEAVNNISLRAQSAGQDTLNQLSTLNTTRLLLWSVSVQSNAEMLLSRSSLLNSAAEGIESRAGFLENEHSQLVIDFGDLQRVVQITQNQTSSLLERAGLEEEANELFRVAEDALNRTSETERRVAEIEMGLGGVAGSIAQTRKNIAEASEELEAAEDKLPSVELFLNATREAVEQFVFNVSTFIAENDRIISEIDDIIAGLADIHSRVNKINSPVQLLNSDIEHSYVSLQSPPSRTIDDNIQFESMDLYLWTGLDFRVPSLLFYAGPVYREETDDIGDEMDNNEDYFLLTVEPGNILRIEWNLGGMGEEFMTPGFQMGFSEIFVTRHGSQFQVRYGVSIGGLGAPGVMGNNNNGSLLFRTSNRTAFLLGGWPQGAQLGVPGSVVPLERYNSFQGQVQLLLFNGEQWGFWNIRGAASANFIGDFQRSSLASANIWRGGTQLSSFVFAISFDGAGYLFAEQLSDFGPFTDNLRMIEIITRPNEESDGLVLYAFDEELSLSLEVAYSNGNLRVLIRSHDTDVVLVDYTPELDSSVIASSGTSGRRIAIAYANGVGFRVNEDSENGVFLPDPSLVRFFTDLSRVQAWYGGVRRDLLREPYIPELTTTGYCGCINLVFQTTVVTSVFNGDHFVDFYLNSNIQKGFAATCLTSIYTRQVAFHGSPEAYLSYTFLNLFVPPNSAPALVGGPSANGARIISFSFVTQMKEGLLLAALGEGSYLVVVLSAGEIEVLIGMQEGTARLVIESKKEVELGTEQYVLIELSSESYSLYFNGELQNSLPSISGLAFDLSTSSSSDTNPVLYVGGLPSDLDIPGIPQQVPAFVGCMKDLAYNFSAMSFINTALSIERRYPANVSYNTCPFVDVSLDPLLAVHPDNPTRRVCLAAPPSELQVTHGGFHRLTTLTTSNIIGLISSSWRLSMLLRQMSDGHVMTVRSAEGHTIRLAIQNGRAVLIIMEGSESGQGQLSEGPPLKEGVFTPVAISCAVDSNLMMLRCSLFVDGVPSEEVAEATHVSPIFFPELPLLFGRVEDDTDSFIGCISELATNGITEGFADVQTDTQCFNRTQSGTGFLGISHLSTLLPEITANNYFAIVFQPQLDNGLVLMLTDADGSIPLLAVGIVNGELRISNFSDGGLVLLENVCDPGNAVFYNLSLDYDEETIEAVVQGTAGNEGVVQLPFSSAREMLLTVGNIPPGFSVPDGSDLFQFLNAGSPRGQLPPGFFGCVSEVIVGNNSLSELSTVSMEQLLNGFCPSA